MYYSETMTAAQVVNTYIPAGTWQVNNTLYMQYLVNAKAALTKANVPPPYLSLTEVQYSEETVESYDYDDEDDCGCECGGDCDYCTEQEKENIMSYDTPRFNQTAEGKRVEYLNDRVSTLFYTKDEELQKQFGLRDDEYPNSPEELVKRIQDGKFLIEEKTQSHVYCSNSPLSRIRFRDPALKRDDVGYKTAYQKMRALFEDTKDAIMIKSADEGLAAVKAFETATIQ